MLGELDWPSLEAHRDRPPLLLFHKIHSGAVSIEKDKYLTPARSLKSTRISHSAQYCIYQPYSDALKNSFFPELFHSGMVYFLQWSIPRLLRSLGHCSFSQNTAERFFLFFFLFCVCFFYCFVFFHQNPKFACYRASSKRKKKRKKERLMQSSMNLFPQSNYI